MEEAMGGQIRRPPLKNGLSKKSRLVLDGLSDDAKIVLPPE
jgi:hypothetical protein